MLYPSYSYQLLGTLGCHLCDEAESLLNSLLLDKYKIDVIDITEAAIYIDQYGLRIPVLRCMETEEELDWPFDRQKIIQFLAKNKEHSLTMSINNT